MLLFLVEQRHRVVSKEELFERLWPGTTVVDATLMGCIQEIRRALADDARTPRFIKTLPKLGYRFMAEVQEVADDLPVETDHALPVIAPPAMPVESTVLREPLWRNVAVSVGIAGLLAGCVWLIAASRTGVARNDDSSAEVAWWKFDEGSGKALANSAGSAGLTGVATGGAWERGVMGGALRLDGTDQRVEGLDKLGILPRGSEPRSLAVWVKVASANGDTTGILHFGTPLVPGALDSFRLFLLPDGRPGFASQHYAGIGDDRSLAVGRSRIDDGNWHHLTGTFANGGGSLFVDGIQQAAVAMPAATKPPERQIHWAVGNHILQRRYRVPRRSG